MALDNNQMMQLIFQLTFKANQNKVGWDSDEDKYSVPITNTITFQIARDDKQQGIVASFINEKTSSSIGELAGSSKRTGQYDIQLKQLLEQAQRQHNDVLYDSLLKTITNSPVIGDISSSSKSIQDKIDGVLARIKGTWNLDYANGKELARIEPNGHYYIDKEIEPWFLIKILSVSDDGNSFEMAKDEMKKYKRHSIEFLVIGNNNTTMTRCNKGDGHALKYTRVAWHERKQYARVFGMRVEKLGAPPSTTAQLIFQLP